MKISSKQYKKCNILVQLTHCRRCDYRFSHTIVSDGQTICTISEQNLFAMLPSHARSMEGVDHVEHKIMGSDSFCAS